MMTKSNKEKVTDTRDGILLTHLLFFSKQEEKGDGAELDRVVFAST